MGRVNRKLAITVAASWALMSIGACGDGQDPATTVTQAGTTIVSAPTAPSTTLAATTSTTAVTTTAPPASSTTSTTMPIALLEPLTSYRFILSVGLTDNPGSGPIEPVHELAGEATTDPMAMRLFGQIHDETIDIVTDGTRWWDLDDPDLELADGDVEFFLGANGLLRPETITSLLADETAWEQTGGKAILGLPVTRYRRQNVVKDVDWEYGDLALIEVWRDELDQLVKFTAWFATGDQTGFPVATWEIAERNPDITIEIPSR